MSRVEAEPPATTMSMMAGGEEEGGVWSKVPDDIAGSIFSRLTVYDIVRAGCACRRFRSLTASHKFLCCLSSSAVTRPNLLLVAAPLHLLGSEWAYDPTLDAWIKLSLAFLQPSLPDFSYPVASSGGLLCFGSGRDFVVCNPITKSWRKLPKVPLVVDMENGQSFRMSFGEDFEQAFGLNWDRISGTYEFVMINHPTSGSESSKMISYSSSLLQWRGQPALVMAETCKLQNINIVSCDSSFYSLWKKGSSLVVYLLSSSEGIWNEIEAPDCSSTLLNAHLMDCHGSLYMVGGVGSVWLRDDMWERPTSICIWKLDVKRKHWMEVTRMPSSVLHDFHQYIDFDQLKCCGKDDVIYLKSHSSGVLMYDFTMSAWKWLKDLDTDMQLGGLILEPSLSSAA